MSEYFLPLSQIPINFDKPTISPTHSTISTGLLDLDRLLNGGIPRPALTLISGYPGVGKTDLTLNIALNAALKAEANVGIVSQDTPVLTIAQRLLRCAADRKIPLPLPNDSIHLWFASTIEIQDICQQANALQQKSGLDLLIVDRIEMIGQNAALRTYVKRLKELAHEANIATIAVTSTITKNTLLSRNPLFATADTVLYLERDDYRYMEREWERLFPNRPYPRGLVDIAVTKNRYGITGSLSALHFERSGIYVDLEFAFSSRTPMIELS